jgi:hypothetical protein
MKMKTSAPLLLLLAAATLSGCASTPSAEEVRGEIERQIPGAHFERAEHLRLGRFSLGVVRWLASFDHDKNDEADRALFNAISGVEIATYKVRSLPAIESLSLPETLERQLRDGGWTTMVRNSEKNEQTWVLYRGGAAVGSGKPEVIRDLYVVSLDAKELSLVRVSGHLDRLMAAAMAEHPKKMAQLAKSAPGALPGRHARR